MLTSEQKQKAAIALIATGVTLFWIAVFGAMIWYGRTEGNKRSQYQNSYQTIKAECDRKGYPFSLYHDNGAQEVPVCREPINETEKKELQERMEYRQKLRDGEVDPPSVDEQCTGHICY